MYTTRGKVKMQGKKPSHREAIRKSLLIELIRNESLRTTPRKAAILQADFDRLVVMAKRGDNAAKNWVESRLSNDKAVTKLYAKLLPRLQGSVSGFTLAARTLPRRGDNADQVILVIKGAVIKDQTSRLAAVLNRGQEKPDLATPANKQPGVVKKVSKLTGNLNRSSAQKKDSTSDTRRIST